MQIRVNGVTFRVEVAGHGPALLLLHGFTGRGENWDPLIHAIGGRRRTIAVDLIGHGETESPPAAARYSMAWAVRDFSALLDSVQEVQADVLGYSLGGRVALQLAARAPDRVRALILESASPGIADPDEREARIRADEELADRIEGDGLERFIDYWERIPLFASQASLQAEILETHRSQRLRNSEVGLANSLRGMGAGAQTSLWHQLGHIRVPTLALAGDLDDKYRDVAGQLGDLMPGSRSHIIHGAGHTVHLEQPERFHEAVLGFLDGDPGSADSTLAPVRVAKGERT